MNNRKIITAWTIYDWANSVYSLVITSSIFQIYYNEVTKDPSKGDMVDFFGFHVRNSPLYSYSLSFSFLLVCIISPLLSGIADYSGRKKLFLKSFALLGSLSCMGLYFFTGLENIEWGIICSILASVGYAGSLVFYNAYLPEITTPDRYDSVSARGFSMGYIGSVILLIINLVMIEQPDLFGIPPGGMAARISFLMVGIWWIGFAQIPFYYLPADKKRALPSGLLMHGYKELKGVFSRLNNHISTKRFLLSFFFYSLGVQTVMLLATSFASHELQLEADVLIPSILIIQLVAIGGAYLFAAVSRRRGNIFSISVMIGLWLVICTAVFFVNKEDPYVAQEFQALAGLVGLVMGGIQSLSRSTYAKLLPQTEDHASWFSFYDVTEKLSIVVGTLLFGLTDHLTGSMRYSVLPLMLSFIIGLIILQRVHYGKLQAATEA